MSIANLKDNLSRHLDYVRRVLVFDRQASIAELPRATGGRASGRSGRARLLALERQGIVRVGSGTLPAALEQPPDGVQAGVLDALLDERAKGC